MFYLVYTYDNMVKYSRLLSRTMFSSDYSFETLLDALRSANPDMNINIFYVNQTSINP